MRTTGMGVRQIHVRNGHHHWDTFFGSEQKARVQFLSLPTIEEKAKEHRAMLPRAWPIDCCRDQPDVIGTIAY
jgi:hypothetical protein